MFVLTLQEGRINASDLVTIELVCMAIKAKFEYGLIFNDVPEKIFKLINKVGKDKLYNQLSVLRKKPSETIILTRDEDIRQKGNQYLKIDSKNREKLLEFLNKLKAYRIEDNSIQRLYISDFQKKVNEMEFKMKKK